jgi:hypothetical protein
LSTATAAGVFGNQVSALILPVMIL